MCLAARVIEEKGIPTVVLATTRDIMARANPPRGVYGNFPLGHPVGRPLDIEFQMNVLKDTLNALTEVTEPGTIKDLPYRWRNDFSWQSQPGVTACYLDKRKSIDEHIDLRYWYDEQGKVHVDSKSGPVPGWDTDWEDK